MTAGSNSSSIPVAPLRYCVYSIYIEAAAITRDGQEDDEMARLTGHDAIEYAEQTEGAILCSYTDPTEEGREGITVDEAREIARQDPTLIYCEPDAEVVWLQSGDSRGTDSRLMRAIWALSGQSWRDAVEIWQEPSNDQLAQLARLIREQGYEPTDVCWGAAGSDWASQS